MSTELAKPTIHMNGTGKDSLLEDYENARTAVEAAVEALRKIECNARDYYQQGPEAWEKARTQHYDRIGKLTAVAEELEQIAIHISDAGSDR